MRDLLGCGLNISYVRSIAEDSLLASSSSATLLSYSIWSPGRLPRGITCNFCLQRRSTSPGFAVLLPKYGATTSELGTRTLLPIRGQHRRADNHFPEDPSYNSCRHRWHSRSRAGRGRLRQSRHHSSEAAPTSRPPEEFSLGRGPTRGSEASGHMNFGVDSGSWPSRTLAATPSLSTRTHSSLRGRGFSFEALRHPLRRASCVPCDSSSDDDFCSPEAAPSLQTKN